MTESRMRSARELYDVMSGIDLKRDVIPISKAASSLAAIIKRGRRDGTVAIVTQKGYPTGGVLPVELISELKEFLLACAGDEAGHKNQPDEREIPDLIDA